MTLGSFLQQSVLTGRCWFDCCVSGQLLRDAVKTSDWGKEVEVPGEETRRTAGGANWSASSWQAEQRAVCLTKQRTQ
ncbi:hypothetical protein E3U43_017051 [Larimichthys crocea]|uniref:Uncharacterized protein n=1 Tax=Larimichthys crocea TaxID=215358 RepID=A0ACD3QY86_LARCR|nr:hypothetical protein E3U43_017051 [Larimichthys crocea]